MLRTPRDASSSGADDHYAFDGSAVIVSE